MAGGPGLRLVGVGLDGVYRPSQAGRPTLARGDWEGADTFVIYYNEGPGLAAYAFRLQFEGDQVVFKIPGRGSYIGHRQ